MAIWQFVFGLVPTQWSGKVGNGPELLVDSDGCCDLGTAWREYEPDPRLISLISKVLPESVSWDADLKCWGDDKGSDIQVWYEGGQVESVMVRLDTRTDTERLCASVVDLAQALDCALYLQATKAIIAPDISTLGKAIAESNAARFSADPREFLRRQH